MAFHIKQLYGVNYYLNTCLLVFVYVLFSYYEHFVSIKISLKANQKQNVKVLSNYIDRTQNVINMHHAYFSFSYSVIMFILNDLYIRSVALCFVEHLIYFFRPCNFFITNPDRQTKIRYV